MRQKQKKHEEKEVQKEEKGGKQEDYWRKVEE